MDLQKASAPEPSRTSHGICTGTLRNLTRYLARNPTEPHHISSPSPSGTSSPNYTGNFQNLTRYLHQNPLEPNFQNLTRYQHQNPPEPWPEPGVEVAPDRTGADLGERPHSEVLLLGKKGSTYLLQSVSSKTSPLTQHKESTNNRNTFYVSPDKTETGKQISPSF